MNILEHNHNRLYNHYIETYFIGERKTLLLKMYEDLGEKLYLAPASSMESYHNAWPGGYLDHILRVADFSFEIYDMYTRIGLEVSDFTEENLAFVALHHDLGKLGAPGPNNETYIPNDSEWHKNKLGQVYKHNPENPFMLIQDQSLFLLQHYGIKLEPVEWLSIKIHDGLYDDVNKPYFITRTPESKLRSNLPYIIHMADLAAARYEYEHWKNKQPSTPKADVKPKSPQSKPQLKDGDLAAAFDSIFSKF